MTHDWHVAMGTDVRYPHGTGTRTLVGHRLLLAVFKGPMSARELHAALGGKVTAEERRAALRELQAVGLVVCSLHSSGARGGRPREEWTLLFPRSAAVARAKAVVRAAGAQPRPRHAPPVSLPSTRVTSDAPSASPVRVGSRRRRRRHPVPAGLADQVLGWVAGGNYLRHFCRRTGAPAARTIYAWAAKDPEFRRKLESARSFGEDVILGRLLQIVDSPIGICGIGGRGAARSFRRNFVRPILLRLQRWRRHPRRASGRP